MKKAYLQPCTVDTTLRVGLHNIAEERSCLSAAYMVHESMEA